MGDAVLQGPLGVACAVAWAVACAVPWAVACAVACEVAWAVACAGGGGEDTARNPELSRGYRRRSTDLRKSMYTQGSKIWFHVATRR